SPVKFIVAAVVYAVVQIQAQAQAPPITIRGTVEVDTGVGQIPDDVPTGPPIRSAIENALLRALRAVLPARVGVPDRAAGLGFAPTDNTSAIEAGNNRSGTYYNGQQDDLNTRTNQFTTTTATTYGSMALSTFGQPPNVMPRESGPGTPLPARMGGKD